MRRLEFDPADIARAKPLSGFIIEVDRCTVSSTSCASSSDTAYDSKYSLAKSLGTDYSSGGGHVEEVFLTYSNVSAGSPSALNVSFTPSLHSMRAGDSIVLHLGYPGILFRLFKSDCMIQGQDASKVSVSVDPVASSIKLTVKAGYSLLLGHLVKITIPESCSFVLPGGNDRNYTQIYGHDGHPAYLPALVLAPVLGAAGSMRFDNCKGTQSCVPTGQTMILPSIQDASSMDTSWSGSLQYSATGSACRSTTIFGSDATFPASRYCSSGVSGDNGQPVGQNPGQGTVTSGTAFTDADEKCRSGQGFRNPCALSIGQDWTMSVSVTYFKDSSSGRVTSAHLNFVRDKILQKGDRLIVPFSTRTLHSCNGTAWNSLPNSVCKPRLKVQVSKTSLSASVHAEWGCEWNIDSSNRQLTIFVGSFVDRNMNVSIHIEGFVADQPTSDNALTEDLVTQVVRGRKTTVIFRDGFSKASYQSLEGEPVANYEQAGNSYFTGDGIYQFRVYSYNGR